METIKIRRPKPDETRLPVVRHFTYNATQGGESLSPQRRHRWKAVANMASLSADFVSWMLLQ
jgi:hypothetical protein